MGPLCHAAGRGASEREGRSHQLLIICSCRPHHSSGRLLAFAGRGGGGMERFFIVGCPRSGTTMLQQALNRDGRDVAASLTRVPWMSPNVYVNFAVWLYYHWVVQAERRRADPNVHFVRYEELVADPERGLRAVLDFLGAPYEPGVAAGHG